jgi:hypothetical protein
MRKECAGSISLSFRSLSSPSLGYPSRCGIYLVEVILFRCNFGPITVCSGPLNSRPHDGVGKRLESILGVDQVDSDAFAVQTRQRSTWRDGEGTKPTIQGSGILAAGKRSVVPPHALTGSTATIARLASANQRHLRWPTDEMGKSRTKSELTIIPQKKP